MGMYAVDTADAAELGELRDAARGGRAAARSRRSQLSQGKQALTGAGAPPAGANLQANGAGVVPAASGQGAPNGAQGAQEQRAVPTDAVASAHSGRSVSMERRRQMSQGKVALNGGAAPPAPETLRADGAVVTPAPQGEGAPKGTTNAQGAPNGTTNAQGAPNGTTAAPTDAVAAAHFGRAVSMERRRQLSQGKQALKGAGAEHLQINRASAPPIANGQGAPNGTTAAPTDAVAAAHFGRAVSMERRRQLSQGKQALTGAAAPAAAQDLHVEGADSGRGRSKARRAEVRRVGSAGVSRPPRVGRVRHVPKVIESPTHGGQKVTGLRIGPGVQVTGGEHGSALPVSGSQYVPADGSAPAPGAGTKVGLVRTPQGLVVSGTTVRNKVGITGDEAGEHLPITGEADQRLDDDLTPRRDGTYRSAQFPRRADPHGATALGTTLAPQAGLAVPTADGPWHPLEVTDGRLPVTGTAVGRSGRVTGNEAGACRPITGDQYQGNSSSSSECGGTGGGTAPGAHLNRARLDPVTGGKVTLAQTWAGQSVTGPNVEHSPSVTGDEPGACRPLTGTPYHGPSTAFGWCEPDEGEVATRRLDPKPEGVAVSGDVPMHAEAVTGTERGQGHDVTGTSYYRDMRRAEPAADDWTATRAFPVALARRLAGSDGAARQETTQPSPPPSSVLGGITGSFAISDGNVTGTRDFLYEARPRSEGEQPAVTGEGRTDGRTVTGSPAAWTVNDRVTGTGGYIAAGRNPSEGGGPIANAWAGAGRFKDLATPGGPRQVQNVTGRVGGTPKDGVRVTVSGGAQG